MTTEAADHVDSLADALGETHVQPVPVAGTEHPAVPAKDAQASANKGGADTGDKRSDLQVGSPDASTEPAAEPASEPAMPALKEDKKPGGTSSRPSAPATHVLEEDKEAGGTGHVSAAHAGTEEIPQDALPALPAPTQAGVGQASNVPDPQPEREREHASGHGSEPGSRPETGPESPLTILSSMFPDLPRETVADVLAAVGDPDQAVQVLLSFSSTTLQEGPAASQPETQLARDAALAHALMAEEQARLPPASTAREGQQQTERRYDPSRLPYQPRVRRAPGQRGTAAGAPSSAPEHAQGQDQGPAWVEELDRFADNASQVAEEGLARAVSTLSAWRARAQALVEQGQQSGGIASWFPRLDGQSAEAAPPSANAGANAQHPASASVPTRQFSHSSEADALPVGEGQLNALSRASSSPSGPATPAKDVKVSPAPGGGQSLSHPPAVPDKPRSPRAVAETGTSTTGRGGSAAGMRAGSGVGAGVAAGAAAGAAVGATAGLAGLDDGEEDNSDDLEYVANPFEEEE